MEYPLYFNSDKIDSTKIKLDFRSLWLRKNHSVSFCFTSAFLSDQKKSDKVLYSNLTCLTIIRRTESQNWFQFEILFRGQNNVRRYTRLIPVVPHFDLECNDFFTIKFQFKAVIALLPGTS